MLPAMDVRKKGACVFDDLVNEIAPKFEACDGMVIGSPVYYASANATLVAFCIGCFIAPRLING